MPSSAVVAAITGGTSGIGRAAALKLGSVGATVAVSGRNEAEGAITVQQVEAAGGTAEFTRVDVCEPDAVAAWIRDTAERHGRFDWLVNNAGLNGQGARLEDYSIEDFEDVIRTNLFGTFYTLHTAIPIMRAGGGGSVVNLGSTASLQGYGLLAAYAASKHALVGLTKAVALENADIPIRVNIICPGPIETPLMDDIEQLVNPEDPAAAHEMFAGTTALKRYGSPAEVAELIHFLLSDASSYITGTAISVDGGVMAGV